MSKDSSLKPQLPDWVVEYLASLGTTPEHLAQHYPHTYDVFTTLSPDEIKTLDKVGAGLALDPPKGDNHKDVDAKEDADEARDPGEKLKKYLCAVH
jgi:hypothetical protein